MPTESDFVKLSYDEKLSFLLPGIKPESHVVGVPYDRTLRLVDRQNL